MIIYLLLTAVTGTQALPNATPKVNTYYPDFGTYVGRFSTLWHDVTGDVYAVDNTTILVKGFNYDGEAPDAYFFAGNRTPKPTNRGFIIPDERSSLEVLGPYKNRNLVLKFPVTTARGQRSFSDIKWISVWCRQYAIDFGHVLIPPGIFLPRPQKAGRLVSNKPLVKSDDVVLEDTQTVIVQDFTYDGSLKDAIFVMGGGNADAQGHQVPNEKGTVDPLKSYEKKTLRLKLPKEAMKEGIQYFGVFSPTNGMIASVTFDQNSFPPPSRDALL